MDEISRLLQFNGRPGIPLGAGLFTHCTTVDGRAIPGCTARVTIVAGDGRSAPF
jgi:hypothetical protein